mmetsp:Transcript_5267/g.9346  ORF Transcript_5267/g.9346 Transcript_5267/m.9346 type:complete len:1208 (+) Transcript_5267:170-3793(+)|eukprot:CAMPEP_0178776640 /NCGR_PEP_ID=MMETSP0745-20121128/49_1 /TAXON_ID=913974 /ORGANISM="Nitzschia punctata, Strain CCMP561" /LENGTH=1207 /DNA_ID=CAMNT_0020433677 /DNA_START=116 /DNA_END=3739 /DNA_ORIENTATION=+
MKFSTNKNKNSNNMFVAFVAANLLAFANAQTYMVGDTVAHEGYVMDRYCIEQGVFLDQPDVATLPNPNLHTVHCLIDAPPCIGSTFELLGEPTWDGDEAAYTRAFVLDDDSKAQVVSLAKELGVCNDCTGDGHLKAGFRVRVTATVTEMANETIGAGPTISVDQVVPVFPYAGQSIELQGAFISDQFCLQRGTFLDNNLPSLEQPELHTVHCLIDPPPCIGSPFEVLLPPAEGESTYIRGYTLDDPSKEQIVEVIKEVGVCDTCNGGGSLVEGFKADLTAIVVDSQRNETAGAGPVISVTEVMANLPADVGDDTGMDTGTDTGVEQEPTGSEDCATEVPTTMTFEEVPISLTYSLVRDEENGWFFAGEVAYEGQGWVGFAISQDGTMPGSIAIIGLPDDPVGTTNPGKYDMPSRTPPILAEQQTLFNSNIEQNATHTVLTFWKLLKEVNEADHVIWPIGDNPFLVAAGSSNELGYHAHRHSFTLTLGCEAANEETTADEEVDVTPGVDVTPVFAVGDEIEVEGFVMDNFCIERGTLLDAPSIVTLEQPNLHSLHCLLDVPQCVESNFEILLDPMPGETMYQRGLTLDEDSKQMVIAMAKELGTCQECSGGRLRHGFRAKLTATVLDAGDDATGAPPMVSVINAQPVLFVTDSSTEATFEVGDLVTVTGFVMDNFCIERGTLLDNPSVVTLEEPNLHSFHCLIDVPQCAASNYEVLLDPAPDAEDQMYSRGFVLDDEGKALVRSLAMEVGICDECDETGTWQFGFRAQIMGTIVELGASGEPPVISIQDAVAVPFEGAAADDGGDAPADDEDAALQTGPVDCSQFVASHEFEGLGLTLNYVVNVDEETGEGNFTGQVVYEGQGWVGFGVSESGAMVGSLAVIGLPDEDISESNPGKYDLGGQSPAAVTLTDQQTILDGNVEQNETHTVLTFTKLLTEPGEMPIDPNGRNVFLAAAGLDNNLGFHAVRGVVALTLAPCTADGGGVAGGAEALDFDNRQTSFAAHGWMACIAWGVLVPVAIGNSLCRHLIPGEGLWFQLHRALNSLAILMTIAFFGVVVAAVSSQPAPDHFKPRTEQGSIGYHKTIGLVVFILALIQGIGGVMRPHLPHKNDDGTFEPKTGIRTAWEFVHKGSGVAILAMAWYQCHSGLVLYAQIFAAEDRTGAFWGVTGTISAIVVGGALTRFCLPGKEAGGKDADGDVDAESPEGPSS